MLPKKSKAINVLVVEDDHSLRVLEFETLSSYDRAHINKDFAVNIKTGLEHFKSFQPDLVLLDIKLPDGTGFDLLRNILRINPEAYVVMMTSSNMADDVRKAQEYGAMGYITKPFSAKRLFDTIDHCFKFHEMLEAMPKEERLNKIRKMQQEAPLLAEKKTPIIRNSTETEPKDKLPSIPEIIKQLNILFVDDYLYNREVAQEKLMNLGCNVETAKDGEETWNKFLNKKYHLIFIDTNIPVYNGYHVANKIRLHEGKCPIGTYIVAMIENQDDIKQKKWLDAGMNGYLLKPCKFEKLKEAIYSYAKAYRDDINETFIE